MVVKSGTFTLPKILKKKSSQLHVMFYILSVKCKYNVVIVKWAKWFRNVSKTTDLKIWINILSSANFVFKS